MPHSIKPVANPRTPETEIDPIFTDRWSPRSYRSDPIPPEMLMALFEAARWSPSSYNEQPWLFIYATTEEDRKRFLSTLVEFNQKWASKAPALMYAVARRRFAKNDKPNKHHAFDTGAAWMAMSLQARRFGLYTHGMAGFDEEKAYEVLGVSKDDYEVMAAIAVGWRDAPSALPDEMRDKEKPNDRKPLREIAMAGRFHPPRD